jgi:hypothetical protein
LHNQRRNRKTQTKQNKERNLLRRKQAEFALSDLNKNCTSAHKLLIEHRKKNTKTHEAKSNENAESNHRGNILIAAAECSKYSRWERKIIRESLWEFFV